MNRTVLSSAAVLLLTIWLSSGTLAPYAASYYFTAPFGDCGYFGNIDHPHFKAAFLMLAGADRGLWDFSVVLRRILFPLFAFPFMKLLGFELGGILASVIIQVAAFATFVFYVRKRIGEKGATAAAWLLATYPGIAYWASLPYCYVVIAPFSLLCAILMLEIDRTEEPKRLARHLFIMGTLFLGYDLFPIFGLATFLLLAKRRRFRMAAAALALFSIPNLGWSLILRFHYHVDLVNANTRIYSEILTGFLEKPDLLGWTASLADLPRVFLANYFYGNFIFLPFLFAALRCTRIFGPPLKLTSVEKCVLAAAAAVFLLINLPPPHHETYRMQGDVIARLYQPIFVVFVLYAARRFQEKQSAISARRLKILAAAVLLGNSFVLVSPLFGGVFTSYVYHRFYKHAGPKTYVENLDCYGRRPLGFCAQRLMRSTSIMWPRQGIRGRAIKSMNRDSGSAQPGISGS